MPNWCSNIVMIKSEDPDEVGKLLEFVANGSSPFSFNKIIVMPPQLREQSAPTTEPEAAENLKLYGAKDWYDWANANWGTKWDANSPAIVYDNTNPMLPGGRTVRIAFDTAWAPPTPVYAALAKLFPNTNIYASYNEAGVGFSGWVMYKNGVEIKSQHYEVSLDEMYMYIGVDNDIFDLVS